MAPSSGGVAERLQYFKHMKKMQWHLGKDTDPSLPAWLGPQKQRIMILGDRGPLFFPFERAQGKKTYQDDSEFAEPVCHLGTFPSRSTT